MMIGQLSIYIQKINLDPYLVPHTNSKVIIDLNVEKRKKNLYDIGLDQIFLV